MDIDAAPTALAQSDRPGDHVELLCFVWAGRIQVLHQKMKFRTCGRPWISLAGFVYRLWSRMTSEHNFERADARNVAADGSPGWTRSACAWARFTGILAALIAISAIFYSPGLYYRDLSVLVALGWVSSPAALLLGPATGWLVSAALAWTIRREARSLHPRIEPVMWGIMGALVGLLIAAAWLWIAVANTPSEHWVP
jgi:hypothetical protein